MKRSFILIFAFISLVISLVLIQETYAKYLSNAEGSTDIAIARWKININNQNIISDSSITNTIRPVFMDNVHTLDGVIAPNSKGYFDLVIDTSQVDVSFIYHISTKINTDSAVKDLKVTSYSINGNPPIPVDGTIDDISNTILLDSKTTVTSLRIYIMWEDSSSEAMNNSADTMASLTNGKAKLDINLSFTQLA